MSRLLLIDLQPVTFPGVVRFDIDLRGSAGSQKEKRLGNIHSKFPSLFIQVCPNRKPGVVTVAVLTDKPELAGKVSKWVNEGFI